MKINEKNLIAFATVRPFDHEGFLQKRGDVNKALQRRYFILKGNLLFYFEKKDDREPLGVVLLEGCTIELSSKYNDSYCFEIAFEGNRSYVLCAESEESMNSWMHALARASYVFKKLEIAHLQQQLNELEEAQNKCKAKMRPMTNDNFGQPAPRHNPFDRTSEPMRPAPPPPALTNTSSTTTSKPLVVIEEHFRMPTEAELTGGNIPQPLPRTKKVKKPQTQQQHQQQHQALSPSTVLTRPMAEGDASIRMASRSRDACTFEEFHEYLRTTTMQCVNAYRQKKYRLIEI